MNKAFTLALLVSLLPIPAMAEKDKDSSKPCFRVDRVLHVDKLDDHQVLVKLRGGKQYILGVEQRCRGLGNAVQYTIVGATGRACPDRLSRIAYREKSRNGDDCRIETITEVTAENPDEAEAPKGSD